MKKVKIKYQRLCGSCAGEIADILGVSVNNLDVEIVHPIFCQNPEPKWIDEETEGFDFAKAFISEKGLSEEFQKWLKEQEKRIREPHGDESK